MQKLSAAMDIAETGPTPMPRSDSNSAAAAAQSSRDNGGNNNDDGNNGNNDDNDDNDDDDDDNNIPPTGLLPGALMRQAGHSRASFTMKTNAFQSKQEQQEKVETADRARLQELQSQSSSTRELVGAARAAIEHWKSEFTQVNGRPPHEDDYHDSYPASLFAEYAAFRGKLSEIAHEVGVIAEHDADEDGDGGGEAGDSESLFTGFQVYWAAAR